MKVEDVKVICVSFRILPDFFTTGIPSIYCSDDTQVQNAITMNKQYRIILVCPAEYIQQLYQCIISQDVHQVFIFGSYPQAKIGDRIVKVMNTKERQLKLNIILSAKNCIHEEEIQLRKLEQYRTADQRAQDVLQLHELIQTLYYERF